MLKLPLSAPLAEGFYANKTYASGPAVILSEPTNKHLFKVGAAAIQERYGFNLKPQVDLLYVHSCLVTVGMNDNDDVFLPDELWQARHTPVLKPFNWQHTDKDIVGVMYGVIAKDINGKIIPFDQEKAPASYELFTEAAIYKLIHDERSKEIMRRSANNSLFVSMESWFDDYDYGILNSDNKLEIIRRTESTVWMDRHLRACGGDGQYNNRKVGRVLRNITFGGCGFVDIPANKRSKIIDVQDFIPDHVSEESVVSLLRKIEQDPEFAWKTAVIPMEEKEFMNADAGNARTAVDVDKVARESAEAAIKVQEEREARAKAEKEQAELRSKAADLERANAELQSQVKKLEADLKEKSDQLGDLESHLSGKHKELDSLVETLAAGNVPSEIAKIDNATDGESAFQAKIAWIQESAKATVVKAQQAEELEDELAAASAAVREQEIREVFNCGLFTDDEVAAYVQAGLNQSDNAYEEWLAQHKLTLAALARGKEHMDQETDDEKNKKAKREKKAESERNIFDALLRRANERHTEGGEEYLQPGSLGQNSRVSPGQVREPRHRLVKGGLLDGAQAIPSPNLSGAEGASGEEAPNPARTLARELYSGVHKDGNNNNGDEDGS